MVLQTPIIERVAKLKQLFDEGHIPKLHQHEVHPDLPMNDRIRYIYFTLPVSLNFQRSSPAMWQSALATYDDPETNYLFYPEKVVITKREKLQQDLRKHSLSLQVNRHTDIWYALSKTLHDYYNDDPREVIKKGQSCVVRIKNLLQITEKKNFPYLSGAKMSNYWLYILLQYTDVNLRNQHKISIIPDTHVLQCSLELGISLENDTPDIVAEKWFKILKGNDITPAQMHPVLWNWSRNKFLPEV